MKKNIFVKIFLIVSGIIGIAIACALLFTPVAFEASAGINLGDDINLISEIRAPSGVLLVAGVVIVLGAFVSKLTYTSLLLSSLIYLSYALGRVVGIIMDGLPNESLLKALIIELVIGLISLFLLIRFNRKEIKKA